MVTFIFRKNMTPRERLQTVLAGKIPDCVPVAPDFSNMIPAKLTGKPFWELYLYQNPPIWEAYIDCAKYFDIDSLMDGFFPLTFPEEIANEPEWDPFIIFKNNERIVVQRAYLENNKRIWHDRVDVFYRADSPARNILPEKIGLPPVPKRWEPVEGIKPVDNSPKGFNRAKSRLGDQGLLGAFVTYSCVLGSEAAIYHYYDNPHLHEKWAESHLVQAEQRFQQILAMDVKPDFLCVGASGTLIFQTVEIFRKLAFPAVKRVIELATAAGIPTHVHSCGPEKALVKIFAEETNLTVIDPLELPPMGDCDLAELKRRFGDKIVLKGNLHTTRTMLHGSVAEVIRASKQAIDDAAVGGKFILATGDQIGRDTPFENIRAMVEAARTYGRY
jgi:hypothetical protein